MKRFVFVFGLIAILVSVLLVGCGKHDVDVGGTAIISLPNGEVVEGELQSITRWSESCYDVVVDGTKYVVHSKNIAIIVKE